MNYFFHRSPETEDTFLLLHGTGGRETDLLEASGTIDPYYSVLGIRGLVKENEHTRFFRRNEDGTLDEEDLENRTHELAMIIKELSSKHAFDLHKLHIIGYSNGANMAVSLLLHYSKWFQTAVLYHPGLPFTDFPVGDLSNKQVFITSGAMDHEVPPGDAYHLKRKLEERGAVVHIHLSNYGHGLMESEFLETKKWWWSHE